MLFSRVQVGKGTSAASVCVSVVCVIVLSVNAIRSEESRRREPQSGSELSATNFIDARLCQTARRKGSSNNNNELLKCRYIYLCCVCLWALINCLIILAKSFSKNMFRTIIAGLSVCVCVFAWTPNQVAQSIALIAVHFWLISLACVRLCVLHVFVCVLTSLVQIIGNFYFRVNSSNFLSVSRWPAFQLTSTQTSKLTHTDIHLGTCKLCRVHNRFIITYYFEYL